MISLEPIGVVRSPWPEKFGIPRQSGLADQIESLVELDRGRIPAEALRGLEGVSHLWLLTWFHASVEDGWRPTVRPPRLGGAARLGVFATRSPHRPNPIALSLVTLRAVEDRCLRITGADLLDGTPVLDIKPYLPWAEARPEARCDWADQRPEPLAVHVSPAVDELLRAREDGDSLRALIVASLRWDPRPAHQRADPDREFAVALADVDVRFVVAGDVLTVVGLRPAQPNLPVM
ncbi:MAG: tRNA (N6-threonylcarbamoyladenosine(37)-N6)-methyltransferase TrmO [Myxococcales bacterium]|nr:tRNA (N6-threonylcarbamoyladenosine(37)-N6)-methyltransferase TrmO [Myxococcales bacterium]